MKVKTKKDIRKLPIYIILILMCLIWLLPIISSLLISLKSPKEYLNTTFYQFSSKIYFMDNVKAFFNNYSVYQNFINSLIYSVVGVTICCLISSMAAFSIVKLRPKFSFAIFLIIYSGTVFPFQMYLIPLFNIYNNLGLYNTKIGMIILYSAICTPFAVFLYRGSLLGITDSIMEAALIDGCSPVKLYANIYLPLLTAPTAVVVLFQAIWIWNDMLFGMILTTTESARPIMVAITQIAGTGGGNIPVLMAGVIITSIPTVLLFIVLRKHFIQGYSFGAYKK